MSFNDELKQWRGNMGQKNACDIFGVSLSVYKNWEQGVTEPNNLEKPEIRWRMAAAKKGISVEWYKANYHSVIQSIVQDILKRPTTTKST